MADFGARGLAVAVIEDGEIVLERAYGYADAEARLPMTIDTRFNAASVSKAVTAWGVMTLVEHGAIGLDDPVFDRITRWRLPDSEFDVRGVTTRRLLSHTSGLNRGTVAIYGPDDVLPTIEAALSGDTAGYGDTRLTIEPGTRFNYAGSGYSLLHLLVEERSGKSLSSYIDTHVFEPLGMRDSEFGWDHQIDPETVYYSEFGQRVPAIRHTEIGAGGANVTLHDLALFAAAHVASDDAPPGRGVLRADTLALMMAPVENAESGGATRWGLGLMITPTPVGRLLVGHDGGNPGVGAFYRVDPVTRDGIVVLVNRSWAHQVARPILCVWRNWSRESGEAEQCTRDPIGLIVQAIAAQGLAAGRERLESERAQQPPEFPDRAVQRVAQQLNYAERSADALEVLRWGVEINPQSASAHEALGDGLAERGDRDGARASYQQAISLTPENATLREKLADLMRD